MALVRIVRKYIKRLKLLSFLARLSSPPFLPYQLFIFIYIWDAPPYMKAAEMEGENRESCGNQ